MHGCRYLTTILFGMAVTGCSPNPTEAPVSSGQPSGGETAAAKAGFIGHGHSGGGFGGGGFGGGAGRFGNGKPRISPGLEGEADGFEGVIDGDYVLQPSGKYIEGYGGKGGTPLVIQLKSGRLPLMPRTDEIGEQLLKLSGSRVRLQGRTETTISTGRRDLGGQQGYRHGIPDHVVHFFTVDSVEAL